MEPLSILHSVNTVQGRGGGVPMFVTPLVNRLAKRGHRVVLVTDYDHESRRDGIEEAVRRVHMRSCMPYMYQIRRLMIEHDFDVIHHHGIWLRLAHAMASIPMSQKYTKILSVHGMLQPNALKIGGWKKKLAWKFFQKRDLLRFDAFHATALAEANAIASHTRREIATIPIGVPDEVLEFRESKVDNLPAAERYCLYLGRLNPVKNLECLIRTWAQVVRDDWRLKIVGNGDESYCNALRQLAHELGVSNSIEFPGLKLGREKLDLISKAQALVLPSHSENFGVVVVEALALGVPVIASSGTPWRILNDRECGWWYGEDGLTLSDSLQSLFCETAYELCLRGERGKFLIDECFLWDRIVDQFEDMYYVR